MTERFTALRSVRISDSEDSLMSPDQCRAHMRMIAIAGIALLHLAAGRLAAQDEGVVPPVLTGLSESEASGTITLPGAQPAPLALTGAGGRAVTLGGAQVDVARDHHVMFFSPTGSVAVVASGPAKFRIGMTEAQIDIELLAGHM